MRAEGLTDLSFTIAQLESVHLSRSLKEYVKAAWNHAEPSPLIWNWHLEAICDHLQAVSEGKITDLLINVPPGCSKSLLTSVFWPTWEWTHRPSGRWFFASYDQHLSTRDSVKCRRLIESRWYQERWGDKFSLTGDQNLKTYFENDRKGYRLATSTGGHGTGEHPDRIVVDDPLDAQGAASDAERKTVNDWWDQTMSTRGVTIGARRVVIMQRLHEEDLSGHILKGGNVVHICLPMKYEPGRMGTTPIGWTDPRTKPGELLAPEQFPEPVVTKLEIALRAYGTAGQLQQRPSPAEGGEVKRKWWQYYEAVPYPMDRVVYSWDATFKDEDTSDYVVGQVWGQKGPHLYLLDQVRDRMDFPTTLSAVQTLRSKWAGKDGLLRDPATTQITLIEDAANGPAIVSSLRNKIPGIIPVKVRAGKLARMRAVSGMIEAGNVFLPQSASFTQDLVDEAAAFPVGANDDQVDACSQAIAYLSPQAWKPVDHEEPVPKTYEELHARQAKKLRDEALNPPSDSVPVRYRQLNGGRR